MTSPCYEVQTLPLDDRRAGKSRSNDPRTSVEAARTCDAQRQRDQIMRLLAASTDGLTPDQLGEQMHPKVYRGTVASRLAQMEHDNLVYTFGVRSNGRKMVQVWFMRAQARVVTVETGGRL